MAALVAVTVLVGLWAAVWAVVNPPFRAPDEPNHLNSALRLAHGGGWPAPGGQYVSRAVERAQAEGGWPGDLPGGRTLHPDATPFVDQAAVPRAERYVITPEDALAVGPSAVVDQMTQHPPAWYAVGAAVLRVTGLADGRWDRALLALRLLDAVLLMPVVPLVAESVRRLTGSRAAALAGACFPLLIPQVGHIMGSATNDSLVMTTCAAVTYLAVRVVTGDLRYRVAVALGLVLGLGMLTKLMAGFAIPAVVLAYLLARGPWRQRLGQGFVALAVSFAVGGWWWARNLIVLGTVQPVGLPRDVSWIAPVNDDVVFKTARGFARSFFGRLSWLEVSLPDSIIRAGVIAVGAIVVAAVIRRGAPRGMATVLAVPAALGVGVMANALSTWAAQDHRLTGLHGRYLFGGIAALAVALGVAVWQAGVRRERWVALGLPVVVLASLASAVAGLVWGFTAFYRGTGESFADAVTRWAAWAPGGAVAVVVTATVSALVAAGLVGFFVRGARSATAGTASRPETASRMPDEARAS